MSKEIKLAAMMGKTVQHKATLKKYCFQSYKREKDEITIATNGEWFQTTIYDLLDFVNQYMVIPDDKHEGQVTIVKPTDVKTVTDLSLSSVQNDTVIFLRNTLLESIKKVKESAGYIPQAKSISDNVSTLINLARVEIEMKTKL